MRCSFPPITEGGWGRIKVKLISNPGLLLLFFSFSFLQFSLPAAARLLFHFFSAAAFIHEEEGRGGNKQNENGSCLFTRSHDSMPIKHRHSVSRLSFLIRHPSADRAREREMGRVRGLQRERKGPERRAPVRWPSQIKARFFVFEHLNTSLWLFQPY